MFMNLSQGYPERVNYVVTSKNCTSKNSILPSILPREKTVRQITAL